jgi:hypothetical protein
VIPQCQVMRRVRRSASHGVRSSRRFASMGRENALATALGTRSQRHSVRTFKNRAVPGIRPVVQHFEDRLVTRWISELTQYQECFSDNNPVLPSSIIAPGIPTRYFVNYAKSMKSNLGFAIACLKTTLALGYVNF